MASEFWGAGEGTPVTRRVVFGFGGKRGELVVSIHPNRPVPDLAGISERMMLEATVPAAEVQPDATVSPQFVFAMAEKDNGNTVVYGPGHRAIDVLRLGEKAEDGHTLDYGERIKRTEAALPPAPVGNDDGALGFLVRTDVLHFYPLVSVPRAEREHFTAGAGSTDDLIQALPFQS